MDVLPVIQNAVVLHSNTLKWQCNDGIFSHDSERASECKTDISQYIKHYQTILVYSYAWADPADRFGAEVLAEGPNLPHF